MDYIIFGVLGLIVGSSILIGISTIGITILTAYTFYKKGASK